MHFPVSQWWIFFFSLEVLFAKAHKLAYLNGMLYTRVNRRNRYGSIYNRDDNNNKASWVFSESEPASHRVNPTRGTFVRMDRIYSNFAGEEKQAGVLWEQINPGRRPSAWLTDSSCMQRWVASAGFTLLAFACLQLAWCSCQPVIDEYHHLKCKRKRLCEGRHDEVPPAGALRDTLGASSSLSPFPCPAPLFYFTAPQSIPLSPFFFLLSFFSAPSFFPPSPVPLSL